MLWSDSVNLTDSSCFIHEPFNFDSHSDVISAKQFVALCHWEYLLTYFITLGIVPPTISTLTSTKPRNRKKNKQCEPSYTLSVHLHRFRQLSSNHSYIPSIRPSLVPSSIPSIRPSPVPSILLITVPKIYKIQ